ncbi:MAG: NUDIX hydrolase [Alphaproteobacteria bacterium]|nr:NUDIX hydrolase [Alphaproteobacteria bacterium]
MTRFVVFVLCFFCLEVNANPVVQKEVHFKYSTLSEYEHPDIANLKYVKHLDGGTGGVHLFEDPKNNKLWTLKSWNSYGHGINEILAALLLNNMGVETPRFIALNTLPDELKNQCNLQGSLFRFAEYVEGVQPSKEGLDSLLPSYFVPLALVSFWDIKPANFILNQHGKLVLIDTGGALLYRSLGESKNEGLDWSKYQMTDLQTLRNSNLSSVAGIFKKITDSDLKNQIASLLSHADKLLSLTDAFCRQLHYKGRKKLLSMLASRLQHAQLLGQISRNVLTLNNDPFAYATSYDAAGTLNYTFVDGKPFLLIGKRAGHNWWGNLGGKSDPEELLLKTAIRETQEESSDQLKFSERDLLLSAAHDLINIHKEGTFTRFRTYLTEIKNPECINDMHDHEYTQYAYIAVDDVLKALKANKVVIAEKQNTIRVNDYILHPPFVESLRQKPVLEWLETLLRPDFNKNMLREKHTQSILGKPDLQEVKEERISHPVLKNLEYAFLTSEKIKRSELKRPIHKNNVDVKPCASDYLLNQLKVKTGISLEATLEESLNTLYPTLNLSNNDINLVSKILEEERQHPDQFVMYHACQSDIWFNYRILSVLRHLLNETHVQTDILRSLDNFFDQFSNAKDLLNYVSNFPNNNNYSAGFKSCGIACNPTFFSNCFVPTSSTFRYFFEGKSVSPPDKTFNIIRETFLEFDLDVDSIIAEFNEFYEKFIKPSDKGALLQFFLDPTIASDACYISAGRGVPVYYKNNNQLIDDPVPVLEFFKQGKLVECFDSSLELQARLHANLSKFPDGLVVVKDYLSGDGDISKIDEFISKILKKHLFDICRNLPKNNAVYHTSPQIQTLLRDAEDFPDGDCEEETPIVKAYKAQDLITIKILLENDPELINQEAINFDTLSSFLLSSTYVPFLMDQAVSVDILQLCQPMIKLHMSDKDIRTIIEFVCVLEKNIKDIEPIISVINPVIESLLKVFYHYDSIIGDDEKTIDNIVTIIKIMSIDQILDFTKVVNFSIQPYVAPKDIYEFIKYVYKLNKNKQKTIIDFIMFITPNLKNNINFVGVKDFINSFSVDWPENVMEAAGILIRKDLWKNHSLFLDDVKNIIYAISKINPDNRISIANLISKLMVSGMKCSSIYELLEMAASPNAESALEAGMILIYSEMDKWFVFDLVKSIFKIKHEDRIPVANALKKYLNFDCSKNGCRKYIEIMEYITSISIDRPESAIEVAGILLRDDLRKNVLFLVKYIKNVINSISKINPDNRVSFVDSINRLIVPEMDYSQISLLLEMTVSSNAESALEAGKILVHSEMDSFCLLRLMRSILKIKHENRIIVVNAIKKYLLDKVNITDPDISVIIENAMRIPIDQLDIVLEKASLLIQPYMSWYNVVRIIESVSADR